MPGFSPRLQRRLSVVVSVIALAAVAWWVSKQGSPRLPSSWTGYLWLVVAAAVFGFGIGVRGWRWHRIMRLARIPHARADAYRLTVVGYMGNNVLPARGGEVLRIAILGNRSTARHREILGSVIAERILDVAVLGALLVPLTWAGVAGSPVGERPADIAIGCLALAGIALAVYLALRRRGRFERFHDKARPVTRALKIFAHAEGVLLAVITAAVWCCDGLTLMLVGHGLGLDLNFLDTTLMIVLASLLAAVPAAPGYVGTFDAGILLGLKAVGVVGDTAFGFVLLTRFVMFVPVTLVGLVVLMTTYGGFKRSRAAPATVAAAP